VQDDVEVPDRYAELLGALVAITILDESHLQGGGIARIELVQGRVDRNAGLLDLGRSIGCGWGLGHGSFNDGVGFFFATTLSFSGSVDVDGAVDGDASEPEEDASVVACKGLDSLEGCAKGVLQDVFRKLGYGQAGENGLAVELVSEPLEEDAGRLPIAPTDPGDDVLLVLYWGQVAGVLARQGRLLSSLPTTREVSQSYTMGSQTRPCL